ncbi:Uncharacterised protein [Streptococcus pneumoniae]|nr:Uncharacterised protein [Streptococcus pneumoniae]
MGVSDSFQRYLIDPFVQQFTSLFDLNGRLACCFSACLMPSPICYFATDDSMG